MFSKLKRIWVLVIYQEFFPKTLSSPHVCGGFPTA